MWKSPGARIAQPEGRISPETQTRTGSADLAERRFASSAVNDAGMCCAIRRGTGNGAGKADKMRASASGPPVDTPITTIWAGSTKRDWGCKRGKAEDELKSCYLTAVLLKWSTAAEDNVESPS